ncbi:dual OB domain-containing protein [Armatimonas rosea]|uniref:Dual OB-containing domain-containing protein n=1 Tax=Armatimonas rosea TaxID=685828 RepID=A0A7W9SW17_ARMRO|nr:hypothetical protein [Armatimonas rosea]MBB6053900.1 hypothetical protein [Armatimonas rosea]
MEVVITGKTKMQGGLCIGGLRLSDWSAIRLLPSDGSRSWPTDSPMKVGEVWNVEGAPNAVLTPPHTEDFRLTVAPSKVRDYGASLKNDIVANVAVAQGNFAALYQGHLLPILSGSICVRRPNVPSFSTQFWIATWDINLRLNGKAYYVVSWQDKTYKMPYVGVEQPVTVIPAGSLIRVSLARWFTPPSHTEEACYLQLSGWWL